MRARVLWWLAACALCAAVFWRAPFVWFRIDDFSLLYLANLPLAEALFEPIGQGTIRVFSERLYFLGLSELFGLTSWPFRVVAMGVWFVNLALIQLVGERLTGSRAAGVLASLLWTISPMLVTPLVWAAAFNEVLIAFVFLGAFYARLRGWRVAEAVLFLAGFGVLEIVVVYPVLVLLHAYTYRREWKRELWMFVPAVAFGLVHLFVIPKTTAEVYRMYFDGRLVSTLGQYLVWTAPVVALIAIGGFAAWQVRKGDRRPLFLLGWFLVPLAPVLPLANHITDYYLTAAGIGMAWLAGWAMAAAWSSGWVARAAAAGLAGYYAWVSIPQVNEATAWHLRITSEIRVAVRAMEATAAKYPGASVALTGISAEVFEHSMPHHPNALVGVPKVWVLPGSEGITKRAEFHTGANELLSEIEAGRARVLDVTPPVARDATRLWAVLAGANR